MDCVSTFGPHRLGVGLGEVVEEVADIFLRLVLCLSMFSIYLPLLTLEIEACELRETLAGLVGAVVH